MTQSNTTVITIFAVMTATGIGIGMVWDIIRCIKKKGNLSERKWSAVFDGIFWVIITIISFFVLLYINDGMLRFFEPLGIMLGLILYFLTISVFFRKFFTIILTILTKICIILLTPWKFVITIVYRILYRSVGAVFRKLQLVNLRIILKIRRTLCMEKKT